MATACSRQNLLYEALAAYTKILEIDPSHRESLLKASMLHIQRKRYAQGEGFLKKLIELEPGNAQAALMLKIAEDNKRLEESVAAMKRAHEAQVETTSPIEIITGLIGAAGRKTKIYASGWVAFPLFLIAIRGVAGPDSAATPWLLYLSLFYTVWLALSLHELGHGVCALFLGDDTALKSGRVTLNPLSHFSTIGSAVVPLFAYLAGGVVFGWAKSAPFNPVNMKRQPLGAVLTAGMGPFTSFMVSYAMFILFMVLAAAHNSIHPESHVWFTAALSDPIKAGAGYLEPFWFVALELTALGAVINLLVGAFNLLPFPPLDGWWILKAAAPRLLTPRVERKATLGGVLALAVAVATGFAPLFLYPAYVALSFYYFVSGAAL
ncbi:MAG: site-2 protease family protein [Nitrospinae bacterium]|nr:site-2 protease family protein [Nitrospinota bacterium]